MVVPRRLRKVGYFLLGHNIVWSSSVMARLYGVKPNTTLIRLSSFKVIISLLYWLSQYSSFPSLIKLLLNEVLPAAVVVGDVWLVVHGPPLLVQLAAPERNLYSSIIQEVFTQLLPNWQRESRKGARNPPFRGEKYWGLMGFLKNNSC